MLGKELKEYGKIFYNEDLMLVHMNLKEGQTIPSHNHQGQEIFFMVVSGKVEVLLNEEEKYILEVKKVLNFKGEINISVKALEESDVFVYLINRRSI